MHAVVVEWLQAQISLTTGYIKPAGKVDAVLSCFDIQPHRESY